MAFWCDVQFKLFIGSRALSLSVTMYKLPITLKVSFWECIRRGDKEGGVRVSYKDINCCSLKNKNLETV